MSGLSPADESSKNSSSSSVGIEDGLGSRTWSNGENDDDFEGEKTDQEVGKYGFLERLKHYMDGELILDENRSRSSLRSWWRRGRMCVRWVL